MIYNFNLHHSPFIRIKSGLKTIEMRLNDEQKSQIKIGDEISFTDRDTNETVSVIVEEIQHYKDFEELYHHYPKRELGYLSEEIADPNDMLTYYTIERIKKYGVIAIKIKLKK